MENNNKYENIASEIKEDIKCLKKLVHEAKTFILNTKIESCTSADENNKELQKRLLEKVEYKLGDCELRILHAEKNLQECPTCNDSMCDEAIHPIATNSVILDVIFGFATVDTLKHCRLVNKSWKEWSEPIFKKKTQLFFSSLKTLKQFLLDYKEEKWNCGHYRISNTGFMMQDAIAVFRQDISVLTSLKLNYVTLQEDGWDFHRFDLSLLFGEHLLKKLVVSCTKTSTRMILKQEKVPSSLQYLDLENCVVELTEDNSKKRCSPTFVKLVNVLFRRSEVNLEEVFIFDFLDLKKIEEMIIFHWAPFTKIFVNLESTDHVVKNLDLQGTSLLTTNKAAKLKNLTINNGDFDISTLPEYLERLELDLREANESLQEYSLPSKLKVLSYAFSEPMPSFLPKFSTCPLLTSLRLKFKGWRGGCDLDWIAPSIKILQLHNFQVIPEDLPVEDQPTHDLEMLVLHDCSDPFILNTISRFKADHLLILLDSTVAEQSMVCLRILEQKAFRKSFVMGDFRWEDKEEFKNNPIYPVVDRISNFYCFSEGKGKAVIDATFLEEVRNIKFDHAFFDPKMFANAHT